MRTVHALALVCLLASCATPHRWAKPDASEAEVQAARSECQEEARSYSFLDTSQSLHDRTTTVPTVRGDRYASLTVQTAQREADIFNTCMHAKGFRLIPVESPASDDSGANPAP